MWQYATGYSQDKGKTWEANGDTVKEPYLLGFLNAMGARDWELVAVTLHPLGTSTYIFKRPKP